MEVIIKRGFLFPFLFFFSFPFLFFFSFLFFFGFWFSLFLSFPANNSNSLCKVRCPLSQVISEPNLENHVDISVGYQSAGYLPPFFFNFVPLPTLTGLDPPFTPLPPTVLKNEPYSIPAGSDEEYLTDILGSGFFNNGLKARVFIPDIQTDYYFHPQFLSSESKIPFVFPDPLMNEA